MVAVVTDYRGKFYFDWEKNNKLIISKYCPPVKKQEKAKNQVHVGRTRHLLLLENLDKSTGIDKNLQKTQLKMHTVIAI